MSWLTRSWAKMMGAPARALAKRLSARFPRESYDGIDLAVDPVLQGQADLFFTRTGEALASAATRAPNGYANLRKDVRRIVLWPREPLASPYHPLQLAALVPLSAVRESETLAYAAWLLYVSGLGRSEKDATERAEEFLLSLDTDQRERVHAWLSADRATAGLGNQSPT